MAFSKSRTDVIASLPQSGRRSNLVRNRVGDCFVAENAPRSDVRVEFTDFEKAIEATDNSLQQNFIACILIFKMNMDRLAFSATHSYAL